MTIPPTLVASLITNRRLCLACIAEQARISIVQAHEVLTAVAVAEPRSLCRCCGKIRMTYSAAEPASVR